MRLEDLGWNVQAGGYIIAVSCSYSTFLKLSAAPPDHVGARRDHASGKQIEVPAMFVTGDREAFEASNNNWFHDRVPQRVYRCVPDAGHRIIHEQSELVTAYIEEFIAG
jgi:pimeloyl-ACP methyl ester carboxylesterase